jgi:hypothetical protein
MIKSSGSVNLPETEPLDSKRSVRYFFGLAERAIWLRSRRKVTEVAVTEELISFASKQDMLVKSKQFWNPDKTQFWIDSGVPPVIDRREP